MALFTPVLCQNSNRKQTNWAAWSRDRRNPSLAVCCSEGTVDLYNGEGELMGFKLQRQYDPTVAVWHNVNPLLLVGWEDGAITPWKLGESTQLREEMPVHKAAVRFLEWNTDGSRLMSGDESGVIVVWRVSQTGRLQELWKGKKGCRLTHCVVREPTTPIEEPAAEEPAHSLNVGIGRRARNPSNEKTVRFFFGGMVGAVQDESGSIPLSSRPGWNAGGGGNAGDPSLSMGGGTVVYYATVDSTGEKSEVHESFRLALPLACLLYDPDTDCLVALSTSMTLNVYNIGHNGVGQERLKVKLNARPVGSSAQGSPLPSAVWAGPSLLATTSGAEDRVFLYHIEKDDNYSLTLTDGGHGLDLGEDRISTISFSPTNMVLAAGTTEGRIAAWKYVGGSGDMSSHWHTQPAVELASAAAHSTPSPITFLSWGGQSGLLASLQESRAYVLSECVLCRRMSQRMSLIQTSSDRIVCEFDLTQGELVRYAAQTNADAKSTKGPAVTLRSEGRIIGAHHNAARASADEKPKAGGLGLKSASGPSSYNVATWSGKSIDVFEVTRMGDQKRIVHLDKECWACCVYEDSLFIASGSKIEVTGLTGNMKKPISFSADEGDPHFVDVNGSHLVAATTRGLLKVFQIIRTAKQVSSGQLLDSSGGPMQNIVSIRVNSSGDYISILCAKSDGRGVSMPDTRVYVYSVSLDRTESYDFGPSRYPTAHFWDPEEPRLLVCESKFLRAEQSVNLDGEDEGRTNPVEATTFFVTPEHGIVKKDNITLDTEADALIGVHVPRLYMAAKNRSDPHQLIVAPMREFQGMENIDDDTKKALLDFSFHLTIGNLDEAYRAARLIKSTSVWENMAHMCVKTKRLDVARICLGNMLHARAAMAVREAESEPEKEARVAAVAIHLGLYDDAEHLYMQCGRYDLLNKLYQALGKWSRAIELAKKHDRIHLRTTHYRYAKDLESVGDMSNAIQHYELSQTHRFEVPRMMYENDAIDQAASYIKQSNDVELFKWWAQYCESNHMLEESLEYYEKAGDFSALVRVFCFQGQFERAEEIVKESGDAAAAYHLARQFEIYNRSAEAIQYYSRAQQFGHAVRLARDQGLDHELMNLSLQSSQKVMVESAKYFDERGMMDKAVHLYHKGGCLSRAVEICFSAKLYDALRTIAEDLSDDADPELLARCAGFFMENQQYDKAVFLLVKGKQFNEALNMAMKFNVRITEEMAEVMTLPKDSNYDDATRIALLNKLAQCCRDQGSYHLACKKFTQAGDKVKAMKCLLQSGDTERIIFFATISKQKDIYILAANYLQSLDWHNEPEIMKSIIQFYTKAKALESLSGFYDACSQVEIDEYRDYEKALGALREALKYMIKAKPMDKEEKIASLQQRIFIVERFVDARKKAKGGQVEDVVDICQSLLDQPDVETAIRVGDVYACLIETYHGQSNMLEAYQLIVKMQERNIVLSPYVDQEMVESIYTAMGIETTAGDMENNGDEVPEDIAGY
eukprot:Rmarinus@m.1241